MDFNLSRFVGIVPGLESAEIRYVIDVCCAELNARRVKGPATHFRPPSPERGSDASYWVACGIAGGHDPETMPWTCVRSEVTCKRCLGTNAFGPAHY